jgi:hypothetical protein
VIPEIETADKPPSVRVFHVSVAVHLNGLRSPETWQHVNVTPDFAGGLAIRPLSWTQPVAGTADHGVTTWEVGAIGFTEDEAVAALEDAVHALLRAEPLP